jgi:hypothetical protein
MCIAIYKPKGKEVPEQYLENAWRGNDDGVGYMFVEKGHIKSFKFMSYRKFIKHYKRHETKERDVVKIGRASGRERVL